MKSLASNDPQSAGAFATVVVAVAVLLIYLALWLLGAYFSARLQNLCWNFTRTQALQFDSRLSARALIRLTVKNLLLTVLTLGLYRPFAVVNTMALRLAAVQVRAWGDVESWHSGEALATQSASGEMAGDFFGIDVGL